MAFTLSTIYKAVDKFSGPLKSMERANSSFAAKQDAAMRRMGKAISSVKNQLFALAGGVSVASILIIGATAVTKYDKALQSLSAITGVTGKEFDKFKAQIIEVATKTKKSAYDVAAAFELVGSAKPELLADAAALSKVTEAAIILSKASRDDLTVSANNLTTAMNQFNLGADQSMRVINVLSAGSVLGAANISLINESLVNFGAVAKGANVSLEQSVGLIETLAAKGLKGAEAGTALRGSIINLQKAGVGYASGAFNINDALEEMKKKYDKLSSAKAKDALLTKTFGMRNIISGRILLENIDQFKELTAGVTDTSWATKQAEINSASFTNKLGELKARFENLIISGNENSKALDKLGKIIGFVTDHLDKIITVIGLGVAAWVAYYTIMTAVRLATISYNVVMGVFFAFQKAVPISLAASSAAMKGYAFATKIAKAATWLFSAALWACPITWIIAAILALVVGIVLLIKHWDKVKAKMDEWSNSAVFQVLKIMNPILMIIDLIKFMQDRWQGIKKAFQEGGFLNGIKAIGKAILSFMLKPIEVILKAIGKIPGMKWATKGAEAISNFRANLDDGLVGAESEKPVNVQKASNDAQTSRYEEITKQNLAIELTNKTDKKANVKTAPAMIPIMTNTF